MIAVQPEGTTLVGRATQAFARYQDGERPALDELIETLTPLLWRIVRETGLDITSSEDVVQTVWLSLLRKADTVRDPHSIVKWLITSTRREAWRISKRVRTDAGRTTDVFGVDGEELAGLPTHQVSLPEDVVLRDDRQRQLWAHVQALPDRCRTLIAVIAFADRPDYSLIAESLGMPVGSIGPTRGRCLAKLRGILAGDPHWEGQLS